jgi:hypothetical protein
VLLVISLIWILVTGHANDYRGETTMWLAVFSIMSFSVFLYHLTAIRYLIRPKVKEQFIK